MPARALYVFVVLAAAVLVAPGCADHEASQLPATAAATIDDQPISKGELAKAVNAKTAGIASAVGRAGQPMFQPPEYRVCVALRTRVAATTGKPTSVDAQRSYCRRWHARARRTTLVSLIDAAWTEKEAARLGLHVSNAQLRTEPRRATEAGYLANPRTRALHAELAARARRQAPAISQADMRRYFSSHRSALRQPERRELSAVVTESRRSAQNTKAKLERGATWRRLAAAQRPDLRAAAHEITFIPVASRDLERPLARRAFATTVGAFVGPIQGTQGWYVIGVRRVLRPFLMSYAQSRRNIRAFLETNGRERASYEYFTRFRRIYRQRTACAEGLEVPLCRNGPAHSREEGFTPALERPALPRGRWIVDHWQ